MGCGPQEPEAGPVAGAGAPSAAAATPPPGTAHQPYGVPGVNPQYHDHRSASRSLSASPASRGYVLYTAPENAFTAEVPQGWQVQTRIDRSSGGGVPWSVYSSPDGQIVIRSPDQPAVGYMLPDPRVGRYEGTRSGIYPVRSYVSGVDHADAHARRIAQHLGCRTAQVTDRRERPDLVRRTRSFLPVQAASNFGQMTSGEAYLDCRVDGGHALLVIAHATSIRFSNGAGWVAVTSSGVAPAERRDEVVAVIEHVNRTMTPNRAWGEAQYAASQRAAQRAQIAAARAQRSRSTASTGTGWSPGSTSSTGTSDAAHDAFINSIRGTQDLTDRYGDTVYGVESYSNYHWQDGQGNIVGTDVDSNPNPLEYERMTPAGGGY
jgi:hypothetical protein